MKEQLGIRNNDQNMKKCPTCGVRLYGRLVDAIKNPYMNESCPKSKKSTILARSAESMEKLERIKKDPLFAALLLGSLMREDERLDDKIGEPDE